MKKRVITGLGGYFSSTLLFYSRPWGSYSSLQVFTAYPGLKLIAYLFARLSSVFNHRATKSAASTLQGAPQDFLMAVFLELPVPVIKGTDLWDKEGEPIWHQKDAFFYLTSLQPSRDAVEVEGVVTPVANQFCANEKMEKILTFPKPRCTPRWWRRPGLPDTRCRDPWCGSWG